MGKITSPAAKDIERYMWEVYKADDKVTALTSVHIREGLKEHWGVDYSTQRIGDGVNSLIRSGFVQRRRDIKPYRPPNHKGGRSANWLSLTSVLKEMDEEKMPPEPNRLETSDPATVTPLEFEKLQKSFAMQNMENDERFNAHAFSFADLAKKCKVFEDNIRGLVSDLEKRIDTNTVRVDSTLDRTDDFVNGYERGFAAGIDAARKHNLT